MSPDVVISVEGLWKQYRYGTISHASLRKDIQSWWARVRGKPDPNLPVGFNPSTIQQFNDSTSAPDRFWALKDINFEVKQGEVLGIIGRNGAGKSTLLKIMSKVTTPTKGQVKIKGRVASLLEVGTGFHPELTGRENIFLNGAILGMTKEEIKKKFDEIVAFAEIEKFIDTPVKRYSSGMYVRLAFAVAAHLETENMVVDEVLAVGDAAFQKKCLGKMGDVAKEGRTILFVSHNLHAIKQLCSKCLLLENGELIKSDETLGVTELYLKRTVNFDVLNAEKYLEEDTDKEFQVLSVRILDESGGVNQEFACDEAVVIELICVSRSKLPGLYGYLDIVNRIGETILTSDTYDIPPNILNSLPPNRYQVIIKIPPRTLGHGEYSVYFSFASHYSIRGFSVDSPRFVCSFSLKDHATQRGNNRAGYLSTLLKWDISPIYEKRS